MPVMNFDLEDGFPPVSFSLKPEDCKRFMDFMAECQQIKEREWVGLTDEERKQLWNEWENGHVVEATEAKLKEKNT